MKTTVYFLFSCFISTGAFMGALYAQYPLFLYLLGFGIWVLFIWGYNSRSKKKAETDQRERMFREHMHMQYRKQDH
jgi:hypothetical protein